MNCYRLFPGNIMKFRAIHQVVGGTGLTTLLTKAGNAFRFDVPFPWPFCRCNIKLAHKWNLILAFALINGICHMHGINASSLGNDMMVGQKNSWLRGVIEESKWTFNLKRMNDKPMIFSFQDSSSCSVNFSPSCIATWRAETRRDIALDFLYKKSRKFQEKRNLYLQVIVNVSHVGAICESPQENRLRLFELSLCTKDTSQITQSCKKTKVRESINIKD